jgi:hypothetical protein
VRFSQLAFLGAILGVSLTLPAAAHDKEKPKDGMHTVDSGSFGIFMGGHRVATETFHIEQGPSGSMSTAEFKTDPGNANQSVQSSKLDLTPSGDIRKYEWKELSPGKAEATVVPANEFLTEHIKKSGDDKAEEQPFLLPASTSILDDYFFSQRQILIWRYLATACKQENGQVKCPANQKTQFGTLNPQQRSSQPVSLEFMGKDKVNIRGAEKELDRFVLKGEGGEWVLWVDDQFKLQRIVITDENTEVLRD